MLKRDCCIYIVTYIYYACVLVTCSAVHVLIVVHVYICHTCTVSLMYFTFGRNYFSSEWVSYRTY